VKPTEVDQLILGVGQDGGLAQVLAQLGRVVVAGHHVQRDAAPGHLLLGPDHPPVQALEHELQEYPVHRVAVLPGLVELLVGGPERVEAGVPDPGLHLVELRGAEHLVAGDLPGDVAAVAGHDWHHRLAGDVTAHDQRCPLRRTWPRSGTSASRCRSRGCASRHGVTAPHRAINGVSNRYASFATALHSLIRDRWFKLRAHVSGHRRTDALSRSWLWALH